MGSFQIFLLVVSSAVAQADAAPRQVIAPEAIAIAIEQLGARDFEVRQRATAFLWQAGPVAERALQAASKSTNAETRLRAKSILEDFRYGVFADSPEEVAALVRRYRRESGKPRDLLWAKILKVASIETLVAIANSERVAARERQVLERLEREGKIEYAVTLAERWRDDHGTSDRTWLDEFVRRHVPHFLAMRQYEKSESLLERSATDGPGIRNWAAFLLLRGELDAKIEELRQQVSRDGASPAEVARARTMLVHMLRVKGDEDSALEMARHVGASDDPLIRDLLFDQRAWNELATWQRGVLAVKPNSIEALGFAAAYNRLAGNSDKFEKHIATIRERAEKLFGGDNLEHYCEALFLNGFTDEAIRLLMREDRAEAFKVQIVRMQYADAFDAAGIGTTRQSRDAWVHHVLEHVDGSANWRFNFRIAIQLAQILSSCGENHEAFEILSQLANAIKDKGEGDQLRELAKAELQAKMFDDAFEHAALAFDKGGTRKSEAITAMFRIYPTAAKTWWDIYSALDPNGTTRQRFTRLRDLFYQRKKHHEVMEQISAARVRVESLGRSHPSRAKWLHAIGEAFLLHKEPDQARQCFESIANEHSPAAIRLADMLAKQEEWIAASDLYHCAWLQDRLPYALYLHGEMLTKAGVEDIGDESKQLARLLPLAGASRYDALASQLARRGFTEVARQECELLRRCLTWSDLQMFHAIASLSQSAKTDNPLRAAAYSEQRMLNCLQTFWHFPDQGNYVRIPWEVHGDRAKGLMKQQKVAEAIAELRMCQQIWPADLNIPEAFVPQLDELGQTEVADEMFTRAYALIEETCGIFPNSALHHNNAAWLAAKCKRRLDDALAHVNRAIELVPNEAQYIDTLGEVYFQQGKVDAAIGCAKQCVELEPKTSFYREQLARFQTAKEQPE